MITKDNQMLLTGVNSIGLMSLLAFTIRTFNDVAANIEDIRSEIEQLKKTSSDNGRRTNIALSHLNTKLDQNLKTVRAAETALSRPSTRKPQRVYVQEEEEDEEDDIRSSSFVETDEISGALSDLLGN